MSSRQNKAIVRRAAAPLAGIAALAGSLAPATAQETQTDSVFTLGTIVVQAPRLPNQPGTVNFLRASEMRLLETPRVGESLNVLPGIHLQPGNRGAGRNETSVYVRGFDLSRVPVLIDGIPVYVPYDGYIDLSRLTTFDLSGIEVSKGFTSVLYGPNAMGGAINLVTRKPRERLEADLTGRLDLAGDGSYKGFRTDLNLGSRLDSVYVQVGASALVQNFWRLPDGFGSAPFQPAGRRLRSDTDDYRVSAKIGYTPNATDEYAFGFVGQYAVKGAPPFAGQDRTRAIFFDWPRYDKESLYFTSRTDLAGSGYVKFRAYFDTFKNTLMRYDNVNYSSQTQPFAFNSSYNDFTVGGSTEIGIEPWQGGMLKFAGHVKGDTHREYGPNTLTSTMRDLTFSLAGTYEHRLTDTVTVTVGGSYDRRNAITAQDPAFAGRVNFQTRDQDGWNLQGGVTWRVWDGGNVFGSVSRKTRFATMFERYSYRLGFALPNPALGPEKAVHYEVGYRGRVIDGIDVEASAFASDVSDLIQSVTVGRRTTPPFNLITQAQNVGDAWFYGVELGTKITVIPRLVVSVNYTYLERELRNRPGVILFGTPRHKIFGYATYDIGWGLSATGSVLFQSKQTTSDTGNGTPIGAYAVANLKLSYAVREWLTVSGGVNNVFDRKYSYDFGYPAEGRNFFVAARLKY